jgi:hypothetical protein
VQDQVLGIDTRRQPPLEADAHAARLAYCQCLGGQRVLALGGADTPGQCAQATEGAGVAVRADQRHAGQRDALFRRDHMHDALPVITQVEEMDAGGDG